MKAIRRIAVLTAGGDCPGLNAVIRVVTMGALHAGVEVLGVHDGYLGLIEGRTSPLVASDVRDILNAGGTILGACNKSDPRRFAVRRDADGKPVFENVLDRCLDLLGRERIDALLVIGGDGSMTVAQSFVEAGVNCIGIPKTIDNDLVGTDVTFGFLTAVATAAEAIDRVQTTAASHHRVLVVEVMGRHAGFLALHAGIASSSHAILIPEIEVSMDKVAALVQERARTGTRHTVIAISEGARPKGGEQVVHRVDPSSPDPIRLGGIAKVVSDELERRTGVESRHVVLGHVQRGGSPIPADRVLATQFGFHAIRLLRAGARNRLVGLKGLELVDVDIREAAGKQRKVPLDSPLVEAARALGVSFGD
ncbi:MAG: 6-phosphofructokinase [Phycisphaeraceae bacterium]|nr:6-phosphofructokinase [Phycisphaeraceae bacterium]